MTEVALFAASFEPKLDPFRSYIRRDLTKKLPISQWVSTNHATAASRHGQDHNSRTNEGACSLNLSLRSLDD